MIHPSPGGARLLAGRLFLPLALALLPGLATGCSDGGSSARRSEGTVRMVERLERIATEVAPRRHPYVRSARLDSLLDRERPAEASRRIPLEARLAREELRAGRTGEAVRRLERLVGELRDHPGAVSPGETLAVLRSLGTAYLRLWYDENCLRGRSVRPCLYPVEGGRNSGRRDAAVSAAELHASLLRGDPSDRTSRWLLNLAHMMKGDYPAGVPERFLIPPGAVAPEEDLSRFPEVGSRLGLDVAGHAGGAVMDDFDGDGDLDLFVSSWHPRDQMRFFVNEGDGTFTDATARAGLEGLTGGLNLAQADYDGDGDLDLLVLRGAWTTYGEPNSLLRNRGDGTFEDVTGEAGLLSSHPTQTASWGDYDGDGRLDLYVGNESRGGRRVPNQLFRNEGDGTFTEVAAETGTDVAGFVKAVQWGDVDNDGRPDLYVSRLGEPNVLLRNEGPDGAGGWSFSDVTEAAGVSEPEASFPIWFWDYDHDGWLDLFVSGYRGTPGDVAAEALGLPHEGETPRLYRNDGDGTFTDVTAAAGLERVLFTMGSNFGDLDGDGRLDFYAGTGEANLQTIVPNRAFRNGADGIFREGTAAVGFGHLGKGHGVAFGDLDGDGDEDVYATMGGAYEGDVARNVLFENPGWDGPWIVLRLEGTTSNASAIGARVRVVTRTSSGRREIHRRVSGGSSFGANSLQLEIGLGEATAVEAVEVTWPATGETDRHGSIEPGRVYRLREGEEASLADPVPSFRLPGADPGAS